MRSYLLSLLALVNGSFFLGSGLLVQNDVAAISGVLLVAIGVLGTRDWFRAALRSGALAVIPQMKENILLETERMQAFYSVYKMAPQILANQEQISQLAQHFQQFELALQELKSQALLQGTTAAAAAVPDEGVARQQAGARQDTGAPQEEAKIRYVSYLDEKATDVFATLQNMGMEKTFATAKGNTLVVCDIGLSELALAELANYVMGNIEIEYWISKKTIWGADLLLLSRDHIVQDGALILKALEKLAPSYDALYVVVHAIAADSLQAAAQPAAQRVVDVDAAAATTDTTIIKSGTTAPVAATVRTVAGGSIAKTKGKISKGATTSRND